MGFLSTLFGKHTHDWDKWVFVSADYGYYGSQGNRQRRTCKTCGLTQETSLYPFAQRQEGIE